MNTKHFALAIYTTTEKKVLRKGGKTELRALVSLSHTGISFNISGYREFNDIDEIFQFMEKNKNHFFGLETLSVVEVILDENKKPISIKLVE